MNNVSDEELLSIYDHTKVIAVVGASADPLKAGHRIPAYLQSQGFRIVPVSPKGGEILGEQVYASLADIPFPIDAVDVFRPSEEAPDIARAAVAAGAKTLWLQTGIESDEAARIASEAGMHYVEDRCMGATHGRLGLGPGPHAND